MGGSDDGENEVVYEEVPDPHVIETGDSIKVKQVLDDATTEALTQSPYEQNFSWENVKMLIMFAACVLAVLAQFYPLPFPQSRPLLGVCCGGYFVLNMYLQYVMTYVDKDTIIITKPKQPSGQILRVRTSFPKYQEWFNLIIEDCNVPANACSARMYVGRYFTAKGEFDEAQYHRDFLLQIRRFDEKKFQQFTFDHKTD